MTHEPTIEATAIDWLIRQRDPAFADWERFSDWLGADPAHASAYHELALLDGDLEALPVHPAPANDAPAEPARLSRRWWLGGALAASLLLGLADTTGKYLAPEYGEFFFYLAVIVIAFLFPRGLFGRAH